MTCVVESLDQTESPVADGCSPCGPSPLLHAASSVQQQSIIAIKIAIFLITSSFFFFYKRSAIFMISKKSSLSSELFAKYSSGEM